MVSKGLEALERLKNTLLAEGYWQDILQDVAVVEEELKALKIIKNHIVNRDLDTSGVYLEYHLGLFEPYYSIEIKRGANQTITEKEHDLLKEVLL